MSLLAPIRIPELSPEEGRYQAATMPTGFGEYLREKFWSGFDNSIFGRLYEQYFSRPEGGPIPPGVSPEIARDMMGINPDARRMTEDEWRELGLDRPGLEYSGGGTVEYETARTRAFDERRYRDSLIGRYQGGALQYTAGFGSAVLGGLLSPENYIPFVGEGARAAMAARMGTIGGRVTAGVADAAIGTTLADVVVLPDLASRGEDVGAADFALDLALGAVTGGLFGAWGGVRAYRAESRARAAMLADTARAVRLDGVERLADALEVAQRALADDEPVDVGPVAAPADAALRRRLKVGTAAPPDARGFDVRGLPEREALPAEGPPAAADDLFVTRGNVRPTSGRSLNRGYLLNQIDPSAENGSRELAIVRTAVDGDTIRIESISSRTVEGDIAKRGTIGRRLLLQLATTIKRDYPGAKYLTGERISGIRVAGAMVKSGEGVEAKVNLDDLIAHGRDAELPLVDEAQARQHVVDALKRMADEPPPVELPPLRPGSALPPAPELPELTARQLDSLARISDSGPESVARFVTDYVTREAEAARHPSIVEAEASVGQAPPKTGLEAAQRLAKDMGLESPPELDDIKVFKRDGLLTAADEAELEAVDELAADAEKWATAFETVSTCVNRYT